MGNIEEESLEKKRKLLKVRISADGMQAFITLPRLDNNGERAVYSVQDIMQALKEHGVIYGIDQDMVLKLAQDPIPGREVVVATGKPFRDGLPGEFEYRFQRNLNRKPVEMPDGSVDYMSIKTVETVQEGDVIVVYHPAIQGEDGILVNGKSHPAKKGRDLPPLGGKNFTRSEDGNTYTADISGKIEIHGNRITISPVYDVQDEVGTKVGNIDFAGDVIIHGGVTNGVYINARGNLTVMGLVENCMLHADGDIFLLKGVKGNGKTMITAGGNITAQFIEYSTVRAGGDIMADVFFKSKVICDGIITLSGKFSSAVGGSMSAVEGIECYSVGNEFGVKTEIRAGISPERLAEVVVMRQKIKAIQENLEKIKDGINQFDILGRRRGVNVQRDPRRVQLLRAKVRDSAVLQEGQMKLKEMENVLERGTHATIMIHKDLYPGVEVSIADQKLIVKDKQSCVEAKKSETGVRLERMD
ncbi:MAG: FapA family protein [Lachnospiraceae bacterium]|nr:FapA family protein [Lachnospiraceae bacterium]